MSCRTDDGEIAEVEVGHASPNILSSLSPFLYLTLTMAALTNIELTEELKREVGQHFVPGFLGTEVGDDVISLIRDYHVG